MKLWDHVVWEGTETHPEKKQSVREVAVFTCPKCGKRISSKTYLNIGYFQLACENHICDPTSKPTPTQEKEEIPF